MEENCLKALLEIADMARDAERYRKLRDCHWDLGGIVVVKNAKDLKLGTHTLARELLDEAVDDLV